MRMIFGAAIYWCQSLHGKARVNISSHLKMFFASTRPKFKLRPPKLLVYYSLCLSILFVVVLDIAQLRATELAPNRKSSRSSTFSPPSNPSYPPDLSEIPLVLNQTNNNRDDSTPAPREPTRADSIDRDDKVDTYDEPRELPVQIDAATSTIVNDLAVSPSNTARHHVQVATATAEAPMARPDEPNHQRASLAELTAAGTAAGLMIHDMMAQANMVNNQFPYVAQQMGDRDDDTPRTQLMQQVLMQAGQQASVPYQTRQEDSAATAAPEPPNENQMPDSIESLMGADGSADAAADEDDETAGKQAQQQQLAGLDEAEVPGAGLLSQQAMNQQQSVMAANESDDEGDGDDDETDDDADRNAQQLVAFQQAGSHLYERNGAVPVLMSSPRYDSPPSGEEDEMMAGKFGAEQEQSLVAPMRDSLVDLNAAAGHYYGKKKKKVKKLKKKIIIKKKKKKKKKKLKYKKIKIVKIKKKKRKVKKKPKKHHHAHHHDHGNYYMYAKVPKKKAWEFGFKKGNKKHWIERHEKGHKNKFRTKVKWYDKKSKGKGVHIWDYNHHDKKKKKHH